MTIKVVLLFFAVTTTLVSFCQNQKQLVDYADEHMAVGDFYGASIYYQKALDIDSSKIDILYKYAVSLKSYNHYSKSAYYFKKVTSKDAAGRIYKDAHLNLGLMLKSIGSYKEASKAFKKSKSIYGRNKKSYEYLKSKQEVSSCSFARRASNISNSEIKVENAGPKINTTHSEFAASWRNEDMLFSTMRFSLNEALEIGNRTNYKVKLHEAQLKDSIWIDNNEIDSIINLLPNHNGNSSFSKDSKTLYFSRCDSLNKCKIFSSVFKNGNWTQPIELTDRINSSSSSNTQPHIAKINDKEYLFFCSNRQGSYGGYDIYFSQIIEGNSFSKPKNAGDQINTLDNDLSPYYNSKNKSLYFSSSWHLGLGGYDIFESSGSPEDGFATPVNLLGPINTSYNDLYFHMDDEYTKGFLTSNRTGIFYEKAPTCCNDIWTVEMVSNEKKDSLVIESLDDLNKYLPVTLYFHNDRPGPRSLDTTVKDNYLTTYHKYKSLQGEYRNEYSKGLKDLQKIEAQLDIDDYFKNYVDKGVSDLALFTKLLLEELDKGQSIEITIKGFASPLAKTEYNVNLTKRRISSLINYLREYGSGEFNKYIDATETNGGSLSFIKIPFGEYTANTNVSDDYYDQRNSIYNRKAAVERKIEIQSITYANKDSAYASLNAPNGTFDFGKLTQGEIVEHTFVIENTGNKTLEIIELETGCDCLKVSSSESSINPGAKGEIKIIYDTKGLIGKQVKSAIVIADSFPRTKRLVITSEIMPAN